MSAGPLVAFETSTRRPTVAVCADDGEPLLGALDGERAHARDLLPALQRLLSAGGWSVRDVRGLAVGFGPGSFTGLRVGVATVLGLERSLGVPAVGVPSMAAAVLDALDDDAVGGQLLDARGGRFYVGAYRTRGDSVEEVIPVSAPRPDELAAVLRDERWLARGSAQLFVDEAARRAALGALDAADVAPALAPAVEPDAARVLRLARHRLDRGDGDPPGSLRPLYLARFGD